MTASGSVANTMLMCTGTSRRGRGNRLAAGHRASIVRASRALEPQVLRQVALDLRGDEPRFREHEDQPRFMRYGSSVASVSSNVIPACIDRPVLGGAQRKECGRAAPGHVSQRSSGALPAHSRSVRRPRAAAARPRGRTIHGLAPSCRRCRSGSGWKTLTANGSTRVVSPIPGGKAPSRARWP